jgi:hypothetical protein
MSTPSSRKHILVTGSHRSGSTWVGNVLSAAKGISYIHEPFNIDVYPHSPVRYWFEYLSAYTDDAHQQEIKGFIENLLRVNLHQLPAEILKRKSLSAIKTLLKQKIAHAQADRRIIKDPIAFMSAEWMAAHFCKFVILTIRHPAAFVASLKVKNWTFDFNHFALQQNLLTAYLFPYEKQIVDFAQKPPDIIQQACLLWNCIHHTIMQYQVNHPDWLFVRHEDLSLYPEAEFEKMFAYLGLPFDDTVKTYLRQSVENVKSTGQNISAKENITNWKKRLTSDEIDCIRNNTKQIADAFYSDEEW